MRDKTLLIGNGLNLTLGRNMSWSKLMTELGSTPSSDFDIPYSLEFERIASTKSCVIGKRNTDVYSELKSDLAKAVEDLGMKPGEVHLAFRDLPMNHLVTTNYDSTFELMYTNLEPIIRNAGSSRNILGPISQAGSIDFYHAHGIAKWNRTICLGHEHYATLVSKIRSQLYSSIDEEDETFIARLITGKQDSLCIWPEYLFTNDVDIVGLGLDYCEIDFWWLLSLRALFFAPCNGLLNYGNVITYYEPVIGGCAVSPHVENKLSVLKALHVDVVLVPAEDYKSAYMTIAKKINEAWR